MYNLLVTALGGAWDLGFYECDKSRFLEYTNEDVYSDLISLDDSSISRLKSYPCLFAYEDDYDDAKIGYLTSIEESGRSILIRFDIDDSIKPIPFSKIQPFSSLLDIRGWEMNRTHWAVKDADLFKILKDKEIIESKDYPRSYKGERGSSAKQPQQKVSKLKGFIGKVFGYSQDEGFEVFYRGHSSQQRYKLEPSLFRKDKYGNYLYKNSEHILYRELLISNWVDFQHDSCALDRLVRMQHYSLPTRLLDITSNPLIALYFACKSSLDEDGEVVLFLVKTSEIKYFDSDVASCIANLARLPQDEKDKIVFESSVLGCDDRDSDCFKGRFNEQSPIKRLIHFIREEKSFFEPVIIPEDLRKIICVKGKRSNDRISSQSGAFLLFGLDAVFDEGGSDQIRVVRIGVSNKKEMLKELDMLNINESTVFPYIENSAKYVAERFRFGASGFLVNT